VVAKKLGKGGGRATKRWKGDLGQCREIKESGRKEKKKESSEERTKVDQANAPLNWSVLQPFCDVAKKNQKRKKKKKELRQKAKNHEGKGDQKFIVRETWKKMSGSLEKRHRKQKGGIGVYRISGLLPCRGMAGRKSRDPKGGGAGGGLLTPNARISHQRTVSKDGVEKRKEKNLFVVGP